jgi:hypothetical protein
MSQAIILAHGYRKELFPLIEHTPSCLFCLLGKPILFHLLDELYALGVRKATLVLYHLPHEVEEAVADGSRFGIEISYLLSHSLKEPCKELFVTLQDVDKKTPLYFCSADSFTKVKNPPPLFAVGGSFAKVRAEELLKLSPHSEEVEIWDELTRVLPTAPGITFSATTIATLVDANLSALKQYQELLLPPTIHKREDILSSRDASIHPSAKLHGPLFIGAGCMIAKGAAIGPNVVIEENCIIDEGAKIEEALIGAGTYIGRGLKICDAAIFKNDLFHLGLNAHVELHDELLFSSLNPFSLKKNFFSFFERAFAFLFSLILFPLIRKFEMSGEDSSGWHFISDHHIKELIVNLPRIAKGRAHFVGVKPRDDKTCATLSKEHLEIIQKQKMGWAFLDYPGDETSAFACDAYYAASHSFFSDLKLFAKKLFNC